MEGRWCLWAALLCSAARHGSTAPGLPARGLHPSSAQEGYAVAKKINIDDCLLGNSVIYSSHLNTFNVYMGSSGKYNLCMC